MSRITSRTVLWGMTGFGISLAILHIVIVFLERTLAQTIPDQSQKILVVNILRYALAGGIGGATLGIAQKPQGKIIHWALAGSIGCALGYLIAFPFFKIFAILLNPIFRLLHSIFGSGVYSSTPSKIMTNLVVGVFAGASLSILQGNWKQRLSLTLAGMLGFGLYGLWISMAWVGIVQVLKTMPWLPLGAQRLISPGFEGAIGGVIIGLCMGWSIANNNMVDSSDSELLKANPISKKLMYLLWLDDHNLSNIRTALVENEPITVVMGDSSEQKEWEITRADMNWLDHVMPFANKAYADGQKGNFYQAIQYYKQALELAPGCDLYLMSIGAAYAMIGQKKKALPFLKRAAEISPGNARIRENLNQVAGDAINSEKLLNNSSELNSSLPVKKQMEKIMSTAMTTSNTEQMLRAYLVQLQSDYGNRPGAVELHQICDQLQTDEQLGFVVKSISENLSHALSEGKPHEVNELFTRFAESSYFVAVTVFPWLTPDEIREHLSDGYTKILKLLATHVAVLDSRSPEEAALDILPWTHLVHWIYCSDGEEAKVYLSLMPEAVNPKADRTISILAEELFNSDERKQIGLPMRKSRGTK